MNILHISNVAGPKGGGISEVVHALIKYQNSLNCAAHLWFPGNNKLKNEVSVKANIDLINLKNLDTLGSEKFGITPSLFFKLEHVKKCYDVIHQHGIWLPISKFTSSISKSKKVIISPHGLLEPEKFIISPLKKKIAYQLYERDNIKNAHCFIASSNQEAESLRLFGITQPIAVIPNGISNNWFNNKRVVNSEFKKTYKIPNNKKILLFLSRIHPIKGLELLIESISEVKDVFLEKDWCFVIAGINELNHVEELQRLTNKLNLNEIIHFLPSMFGSEKLSAFDDAAFFILPSKSENFGIVVIEALARGVPVISTKRTPWSDLNKHKCGFWIDRTKEAFKECLNEVLNLDETSLMKMGYNGKILVKEKYLWESVTQQTLAVYKWVINNFDNQYKIGFEIF